MQRRGHWVYWIQTGLNNIRKERKVSSAEDISCYFTNKKKEVVILGDLGSDIYTFSLHVCVIGTVIQPRFCPSVILLKSSWISCSVVLPRGGALLLQWRRSLPDSCLQFIYSRGAGKRLLQLFCLFLHFVSASSWKFQSRVGPASFSTKQGKKSNVKRAVCSALWKGGWNVPGRRRSQTSLNCSIIFVQIVPQTNVGSPPESHVQIRHLIYNNGL